MNLPNKLTVARIIATPIFMFAMITSFPGHYIVALVIFALASYTDYLDGKIARRDGLVTDFGKFLDPLADKMLTTAAYLGLLAAHACPGITWIVFIVLFREFMITSLRLVAVQNGTVIAANMWGKAKTVCQMVSIIVTLAIAAIANIVPNISNTLAAIFMLIITLLLWTSAVLTVISGVVYMVQNKDAFLSSK